MPVRLVRGLCLLSLAALPALASAAALVRISCDDAAEGAEITVNGVSKGTCSLDVMVEPGRSVIRARKQPDASHEQLWETTVVLGDGAVKRVDVTLSAPQLTAEARRELDRQARDKAAAEQRADLAAAQAGDEAAMARVVTRLEAAGAGKDAAFWRGRLETVRATRVLAAANGGAVDAMDEMATRYEKGQGVAADPARAAEWREKAVAAHNQKLAQMRRAALQKEHDDISFFGVTQGVMKRAGDLLTGRAKDVTSGPTGATSAVIYLPLWLASDASSAPFRTSDLLRVNKELEALALRPAAWGSPDSLLARATPVTPAQ